MLRKAPETGKVLVFLPRCRKDQMVRGFLV